LRFARKIPSPADAPFCIGMQDHVGGHLIDGEVETIFDNIRPLTRRHFVRNPTFIAFLSLFAVAAAVAGPVDSAIVAAMKLPDAPNYSWRTDVVDDGRTYEVVGATDRATDYSLVTQPLVNAVARRAPRGGGASSNVATLIFKGPEQFVIQSDDGWRSSGEMLSGSDRGGSRRGGLSGPPGMGGLPGMGGPRGRGSRGGGGGGEAAGYSNLQNTLSRPHEEIAIIVAGAADLKVEEDVITGSLSETAAKLMLVHAGQKTITPLRASGTVRLWVRNGVLLKYETRLEGVLSVESSGGRREVAVHQTATTTLTEVGTTKFEVPAEAMKKLG
jgi:hypothetical protein